MAPVDLRRADPVALALLGHLGGQRALLGPPGPGRVPARRGGGHPPRDLRGLEPPGGARGRSLDPALPADPHHRLAAVRHRGLRHLRRERPVPDRPRGLLPHRSQHLPRGARHESPAPAGCAHAGGGRADRPPEGRAAVGPAVHLHRAAARHRGGVDRGHRRGDDRGEVGPRLRALGRVLRRPDGHLRGHHVLGRPAGLRLRSGHPPRLPGGVALAHAGSAGWSRSRASTSRSRPRSSPRFSGRRAAASPRC